MGVGAVVHGIKITKDRPTGHTQNKMTIYVPSAQNILDIGIVFSRNLEFKGKFTITK